MTNQEKAKMYDEIIRQTDALQRKNSKLKSEYAGNIPENVQREINENEYKISVLVGKVENLFR